MSRRSSSLSRMESVKLCERATAWSFCLFDCRAAASGLLENRTDALPTGDRSGLEKRMDALPGGERSTAAGELSMWKARPCAAGGPAATLFAVWSACFTARRADSTASEVCLACAAARGLWLAALGAQGILRVGCWGETARGLVPPARPLGRVDTLWLAGDLGYDGLVLPHLSAQLLRLRGEDCAEPPWLCEATLPLGEHCAGRCCVGKLSLGTWLLWLLTVGGGDLAGLKLALWHGATLALWHGATERRRSRPRLSASDWVEDPRLSRSEAAPSAGRPALGLLWTLGRPTALGLLGLLASEDMKTPDRDMAAIYGGLCGGKLCLTT